MRRRLLGIAPMETTFARRGFTAVSREAQEHLENVGYHFVEGYHHALQTGDDCALQAELASSSRDYRGFAYEGAAMALGLVDGLSFSRTRLRAFVEGPGQPHIYMVHVGLGWAAARLPWLRRELLRGQERVRDPLLRWLQVDGLGFHQGFFHPQHYVHSPTPPTPYTGYTQRAFDQGLGRSLWFVFGCHPQQVLDCIAKFPRTRRPDLFAGVGLACTYAGGSSPNHLEDLCRRAGSYFPHLAQGSVFAAAARSRAGLANAHTLAACRLICRLTPDRAADLAHRTQLDLSPETSPPSDPRALTHWRPAYEQWRCHIRNSFPALSQSLDDVDHSAHVASSFDTRRPCDALIDP
ncbi:MAG: DUF1702 family protein [Planctomycetales bacterium]|nr:DUF1702 family protein [Planctomycetales bacterium]